MYTFESIEKLKNISEEEREKLLKIFTNDSYTIEYHQGRAMGALLVMAIENGLGDLVLSIIKKIEKLIYHNEIPILKEYDKVLTHLNYNRKSLPNIKTLLDVMDSIAFCFYENYGYDSNGNKVTGLPVPSSTSLKSFIHGYTQYMSNYYQNIVHDKEQKENMYSMNEIIKPMFD